MGNAFTVATQATISDIESMIDLAEKVAEHIAKINERLEKLQARLTIAMVASSFGVLLGVSISPKLASVNGFSDVSQVFVISMVSLAIVVGSFLLAFLQVSLMQRKGLRRELGKERAVLTRIVDLIHEAKSRVDDNDASFAYKAVLEMRLQRIAFDKY